MTKRVAIYARVSTDDQAEKGYSLPSQIEACRSFTEKLGYVVSVELSEDHSGATPISERPQGARLIDMAKRREVDAVIVYQVDRLSRDIVNLLATVQTWLRAGVEVYSLDVGKIESELDIVLVIKGWQGSDERKKIRERCMRGKRAKAKAGKVVGTRAPYGYKHTRDGQGRIETLEPVDEGAQIVRLIYRWYVLGDESGKIFSMLGIARRLSEMGVPTPGEVNTGFHRKRGAGLWYAPTIKSIISNEVYAGVWQYGIRIGGSSINKRPREEWIAVNVPAIVDRELWESAQAQRARNRELSKRNKHHEYLLSGYIKCSCGRTMGGGHWGKYRRGYYTCNWRNYHHSKLEERPCNMPYVRMEAIEADVWESIIGLFSDTTRFEKLLRIAQQAELSALDPKQEEYTAVQNMLIDTERAAAEIGQALRRASGIVAKSLENDMHEINRRYEAICKRLDVLQRELNATHLTDDTIHAALDFAEDMRKGIENADFETRRRIIELLQIKVVIKDGQFYVSGLVGMWEGEIRKLEKVKRIPIASNSL